MGKFSHIIMPWKSKAQKKYRYKEEFTLQTSPNLPQSELDKKIFHPDWKLRAGWEWKKGENRDGHPMFIFQHGDQKTRCFGIAYSEDHLANERASEFQKEWKNRQWYYRPAKKSYASRSDGNGRCGYR